MGWWQNYAQFLFNNQINPTDSGAISSQDVFTVGNAVCELASHVFEIVTSVPIETVCW